MVNRKGVFIGAYVPAELKESLKRRAATEHRTLSQEITRILRRSCSRTRSARRKRRSPRQGFDAAPPRNRSASAQT